MPDHDIVVPLLIAIAFAAAVLLAAGLAIALALVCGRHRACRHELARVAHAKCQLELRLARIAPRAISDAERRFIAGGAGDPGGRRA